MIDVPNTIYALLQGKGVQAGHEKEPGLEILQTKVGTNIWLGQAPRHWDGETAAIVFSYVSPPAHGATGDMVADVYFRCFPGSDRLLEAIELEGLLFDALHQLNFATTNYNTVLHVHHIQSSSMPPEPETGLLSHTSVYRFVLTE